ncbi:multifunctional CCA addition/repair protein [Noviherbaspirillum pedocola]|uniref:CCA-adding enzyme n=1 Tax=Noviherbaspirillum pedocola TaxID=2801341 RepID=A0A934W843_9BURK|nr:multifunctional CCA addition/repair protein [Noviherbaspirillum pedocola]MBK4736378.1 multifunctional CCA addition/repair protein [Noviherbaspirillum pedocola]
MKTYVVGGAVRDRLLGLPVQDRDHVVVGATPEDMIRAGFRPVGKDFPVFLHPQTSEEYALARTERKTAPGYKGFVFHTAADVTLEQDLVRRDLTINAIAEDENGVLIDPHGGQRDLQARLFRHVSDAFAEDPVRILRLARFAARFTDFLVAPETNALMRAMVEAGEVDALVPERVWQEVARGLMEQQPSRMFAVLRGCGALARLLPEVESLWQLPASNADQEAGSAGEQMLRVVDVAAQLSEPLPVRYAAMLQALGALPEGAKAVDSVNRRLKAPNECRDLAVMTAREFGQITGSSGATPAELVTLLERCDAFRKPERFLECLEAARCAQLASTSELSSFPQAQRLHIALDAARSVDAGAIAGETRERWPSEPLRIPQAVREARIAAVANALMHFSA